MADQRIPRSCVVRDSMTEYRRAYAPGATWFFTVNLAQRKNTRLLAERFDVLRDAFKYVR